MAAMTTDEFRAWLAEAFPNHAKRGRPTKGSSGDSEAAASALGITVRSLSRKRAGKQPITSRDEALIRRLST